METIKNAIISIIASAGLILFIGGVTPRWNILGIVIIAVAGILYNLWFDRNDYSKWENEFINHKNNTENGK